MESAHAGAGHRPGDRVPPPDLPLRCQANSSGEAQRGSVRQMSAKHPSCQLGRAPLFKGRCPANRRVSVLNPEELRGERAQLSLEEHYVAKTNRPLSTPPLFFPLGQATPTCGRAKAGLRGVAWVTSCVQSVALVPTLTKQYIGLRHKRNLLGLLCIGRSAAGCFNGFQGTRVLEVIQRAQPAGPPSRRSWVSSSANSSRARCSSRFASASSFCFCARNGR